MDPLFFTTPEFKNTTYHILSDEVSKWQQEIIELLTERFNGLSNKNMTVKFNKINEKTGYAVGAVEIKQSKNTIHIPMVVRNFNLAPMDIMSVGDDFLPMTETSLEEVLLERGIGDKTVPATTGSDVQSSTDMPGLGGRVVTSSVKYPMLDYLSGTFDKNDVNNFKNILTDDPGIAVGLKKFAEPIKKIMGDVQVSVKKKVGVLQARRDGENKYSLLSQEDDAYAPSVVKTDRDGLLEVMSRVKGKPEDVNEIDELGEKILISGDIDQEPFLYTDLKPVGDIIKEYGRYIVQTPEGTEATGWVFPNVINFNQKKVDMTLFVNKAMSALQQYIVGAPTDKETPLPVSNPEPGKIGTFVYTDGGKALATVPFTVGSIGTYQGETNIKGTDTYGNNISLIISSNVKAITKTKSNSVLSSDNTYLIPDEMSFVPMIGNKKLLDDVNIFDKTAKQERLYAEPTRLFFNGDRFALQHSAASNYNNDVMDVSFMKRADVNFLFASFGVGEKTRNRLIKQAESEQCIEIHGFNYPTEKTAADKSDLKKFVHDIKPHMFKEAGCLFGVMGSAFEKIAKRNNPTHSNAMIKKASDMETSEVVDKVLGLNFITPDNIMKFIVMLPHLEETQKKVAKLIMAARLGVTDLPEAASVSVMNNLTKVIEGLRKLQLQSRMS